MLGVDERCDAASLLGIGDDVQTQSRLAAGLGAVDLGDTTPRDPPDADGGVQVDRSGWDRIDPNSVLSPQPHDRALTHALLDLRDGQIQRLFLVVLHHGNRHFYVPRVWCLTP